MHLPPISRLLLYLTLLLPAAAYADCTATGLANPGDGHAIAIPFGKVTLSSPQLQPPGSLLASAMAASSDYHHRGASAGDALWICDKDDLPQLHFLVANNADSRFGGLHAVAEAGLSDVYATWFFNVGLSQSIGGVPLTRNWQEVPLRTWHEQGDLIHIRLQDIPPLRAELYRVSQALPPDTGATRYCGDNSHLPRPGGTPYPCQIATGYIQLVGPGLKHDKAGAPSGVDDRFMEDNGIAWRLYDGLSLTSIASCVVHSATAEVQFPAISTQRIQNGDVSSADFSVGLECSQSVISGTGSGQTAMGLQALPGALVAAQKLGLVNANGGIHWLLSDEYDTDPDLARGVGIRLYRSGEQTPLPFLAKADTGGGADAGWIPVLQGANRAGSGTDRNYAHWQMDFTATLARIPGQAITPGKVRASAYVVVKVQ